MKSDKGTAFGLFALFLPVLIAVLGLIVDGGLFMYSKTRLDMATEAAALSTISTYDKSIYASEGRVVLDQASSKVVATKYLKVNFPEAKLEKVTIAPENTATVESSLVVEFCFMKVFGIENKKIYTSCKSIGG